VGTHGREPEFERWVGDTGLLVVHFSPIPPHYYNIRPVLVWLLLEWIGGGLGGQLGSLPCRRCLLFINALFSVIVGRC